MYGHPNSGSSSPKQIGWINPAGNRHTLIPPTAGSVPRGMNPTTPGRTPLRYDPRAAPFRSNIPSFTCQITAQPSDRTPKVQLEVLASQLEYHLTTLAITYDESLSFFDDLRLFFASKYGLIWQAQAWFITDVDDLAKEFRETWGKRFWGRDTPEEIIQGLSVKVSMFFHCIRAICVEIAELEASYSFSTLVLSFSQEDCQVMGQTHLERFVRGIAMIAGREEKIQEDKKRTSNQRTIYLKLRVEKHVTPENSHHHQASDETIRAAPTMPTLIGRGFTRKDTINAIIDNARLLGLGPTPMYDHSVVHTFQPTDRRTALFSAPLYPGIPAIDIIQSRQRGQGGMWGTQPQPQGGQEGVDPRWARPENPFGLWQ